jgi:pimeloyl-ACP methyl ester carboxylesterase
VQMARFAALLAVLVLLAGSAGAATATSRPPTDACVPKSLRSTAIGFRTRDGVRLAGLLLGSGKKGIVLAHEIRGWLCNWLPFAQTLAKAGYRVLAYDSRNAGVSGVASYAGSAHLERDVLAAEHELLRRGVTRIVVGGASAGGTAAMTAAAASGRALTGVVVLSSPAHFGAMDAEAAARRVTVPSFFAVGRDDTAFVAEVHKLYDASAAKDKQLEVLDTGDHGTALLAGSAGAGLRAKLLAFFARAFRP